MDLLNPPTPTGRSSQGSLERDLRTLRLTVQIMLVSLVILSGSLGLYLFRQVSLLRRQVDASSRMAHQMATHFNFNLKTQAMAFEKQLLDFGQTNPAFQQQIARYFVSTTAPSDQGSSPANAAPGAGPASSTPPKP